MQNLTRKRKRRDVSRSDVTAVEVKFQGFLIKKKDLSPLGGRMVEVQSEKVKIEKPSSEGEGHS